MPNNTSLPTLLDSFPRLPWQVPFFATTQLKSLFPKGTKRETYRAEVHRSGLEDFFDHVRLPIPRQLHLYRCDDRLKPIHICKDITDTSQPRKIAEKTKWAYATQPADFRYARLYFQNARISQEVFERNKQWIEPSICDPGPHGYVKMLKRFEPINYRAVLKNPHLLLPVYSWLALAEVFLAYATAKGVEQLHDDWWRPCFQTSGLAEMQFAVCQLAPETTTAIAYARNLRVDFLHVDAALRFKYGFPRYLLY